MVGTSLSTHDRPMLHVTKNRRTDMYLSRLNPLKKSQRKPGAEFGVDRHRLRNPRLDAEPSRSPFDSLARGLVAIGDRLRAPQSLRVL
jgi:hypothetical protein